MLLTRADADEDESRILGETYEEVAGLVEGRQAAVVADGWSGRSLSMISSTFRFTFVV